MGHRKKLVKPALKKVYAQKVADKFDISCRRACRLIGISRKSIKYQSLKSKEDESLKERLVEMASK